MLKKVDSLMFKACEVNFSEEELIIKQEIDDEDNEKKNAETTPSSKTEKKPMANQGSKTPVKEMKTEDARKKKKKNRNGKIEINKINNHYQIYGLQQHPIKNVALCDLQLKNMIYANIITKCWFNGFLGLPVEFELEVPLRAPSGRFSESQGYDGGSEVSNEGQHSACMEAVPVLLWLKQWDSCVFGSEIKTTTEDVLSSLRWHTSVAQHQKSNKSYFGKNQESWQNTETFRKYKKPDQENNYLKGSQDLWNKNRKGYETPEQKFEEIVVPLVTFEDNNKGFTMGYEKLISGNVVIDDITLVAGLEVNLLSVSQFADKGARKGSLFVADLDSANEDEICCFYTKASVEQSKLWHKKLTHLNFKAINTLVKKELVRDMPNLEFAQDEVCDACQKEKMKRLSHKSKIVNFISAHLELIHMDLFGPVNVQSISRKRYALVMVDDYSRYTWVEFMYSKDETPHIIIEHIKKIEKQVEDQNCVKRLRSDQECNSN
ncbi:hypothetical protein AgCh_019671 [Apium graveolens]